MIIQVPGPAISREEYCKNILEERNNFGMSNAECGWQTTCVHHKLGGEDFPIVLENRTYGNNESDQEGVFLIKGFDKNVHYIKGSITVDHRQTEDNLYSDRFYTFNGVVVDLSGNVTKVESSAQEGVFAYGKNDTMIGPVTTSKDDPLNLLNTFSAVLSKYQNFEEGMTDDNEDLEDVK